LRQLARLEPITAVTPVFHAGLPDARVGVPNDVARMVLLPAFDDSSYRTGAEFVGDGGLLVGRSAPAAAPVDQRGATQRPVPVWRSPSLSA